MKREGTRRMVRMGLVAACVLGASWSIAGCQLIPGLTKTSTKPDATQGATFKVPAWLHGIWSRTDEETKRTDRLTIEADRIESYSGGGGSSSQGSLSRGYVAFGYTIQETEASGTYRIDHFDQGKSIGYDLFERLEEGRMRYTTENRYGKTRTMELAKEGAAVAQVAPAASATASPEPNYFPLSDGVEWTYDMAVNETRVGRVNVKAGAVKSEAGVVTTQVTHTTSTYDAEGRSIENQQVFTYRKVADELSYVSEQGVRRIELKLPLAVGETWMDQGLEVEVERQEDIKVPYKAFAKAMKVTMTGAKGVSATNWYADGYGMVRSETVAADGTRLLLELVDYKIYLFSDERKDHSNPVYARQLD